MTSVLKIGIVSCLLSGLAGCSVAPQKDHGEEAMRQILELQQQQQDLQRRIDLLEQVIRQSPATR